MRHILLSFFGVTASLLLGSCATPIGFADDAPPHDKASFRAVLDTRQRELLREVARYVEQHPTADDVDEAFVWSFDTARRFGLEADAMPLAQRFLQDRSANPLLRTVAKQVLCLGLAKSRKLAQAVEVFQDSLQFVRFNAAGESLDLAGELAAQAGLAGDHATAKGVYETLTNRLGLNPQIGEFCENRVKKLELVGQQAAELDLTDLSGKPASVLAARGGVLLIDFWATNCPPCLAEFPKLKQLYADYHQKGFDVIGISLDESRDSVDAFQSRAQLPWRLVVDVEQVRQAREKYRVRTIPSLFVVGRDGRIAQVDLKGNDLRQAVERCLKEKGPQP